MEVWCHFSVSISQVSDCIFKLPSFEKNTVTVMITWFCWVNNSIYCFIFRKTKETHNFTWIVVTRPHSQLSVRTWTFMRCNIEANHHPIVPFTSRPVIRMTSKHDSIAYVLEVCKELFHVIKKEIFVFVRKFNPFHNVWVETYLIHEVFLSTPHRYTYPVPTNGNFKSCRVW